MKKVISLLLAAIMLLCGCTAPISDDTTTIPDDSTPTSDDTVIDTVDTDSQETDPPIKIDREDFTIDVKDDAYVFDSDNKGSYVDTNFGAENDIELKSNGKTYTRYGYLKFDISSLEGDSDFTCIEITLTLKTKQNDVPYASVAMYGADAEGWDETTVTFNTQPKIHELVAMRNDIAGEGTSYTFPVTSYVKKALSEGKTEVAFYLMDATSVPQHILLNSKESGKGGPIMSIYYGTKTDTTYEPEISENGLDAILGLRKTEVAKIDAVEDTYVEAGSSANTNFGASNIIDFKASAGKINQYYRISLIKFDVSKLKDAEFSSVMLELNCTVIEGSNEQIPVNVYGCFPTDWSEMTVTYNTRPEREKFITSTTVSGPGLVRVDVTDYVKKQLELGFDSVSFYLEGSNELVRRIMFSSRESGLSAPCLEAKNGNVAFSTYLKYADENPWEVAMENVSDWLDRWETVKQGGDSGVETLVKDPAEYSLTVSAANASSTNGDKTYYNEYPTRNISTLKDFTADRSEAKLYDEYGGYTGNGKYGDATGYFYTVKVGDRWWTIDPLGYPYFRVACNTLVIGNTKQSQLMLSKYGTVEKWAEAATDRLRELGFNSAGGWGSSSLNNVDEPLSQTKIMFVLKKYCQTNGLDVTTGGNTALMYNVMPVFDPAFEGSADLTVKNSVIGYEASPYIYGWMSDNELPDSERMLDSSLTLDTDDMRFIYSYATAWTFMYLKTGKADVSVNDVTDELRREYRAMVYDRYFKVVRAALDKYAPNHQYMGCRFLAGCFKDEYVMRVAGYWCDTVTLNYYGVWEADAAVVANMQKWSGKPFVVTEWYAKGMDAWEKDNLMTNVSGAGWTVKTQDDRGRFYQNFALALLECKGCVGFDWFKYWDDDPTDLTADESSRNSNKGIIDNYGNEYAELTKYMDELNNQKYHLVEFFDER